MRTITGHQVNPANDIIAITVMDEPGAGGANHNYDISWGLGEHEGININFQNGPIAEAGVNGVTHEALIAILIDRLECFQSGQFANVYNQTALDSLRVAQEALLTRTRERMARGVEGTHKV
jgi:hypothetical protein